MNEFTTLYNQLVANIQKISSNVSTLQKVVNKIGTAEDNSHLRSHLKSLEEETNHLAKQSNRDIQQLSRQTQTTDTNQSTERKFLSQKIRSDFSDVLQKFQEIQIKASQSVKQFALKPEIKSNNPFLTNDEYNFESTTLSFKEEAAPQLQQQMNAEEEERNRIKLAEEQNEAVRQLESNIVDVNQIFQDLAKMVYDQQSLFDNIERNVESTEVRIESGTQELRNAAEYQRKARKKRLLIVIIFACIIALITLIIYFSVNH